MDYATQATSAATPKQRPQLREQLHSFSAAVEHLDVVHTRLCNMRDRLVGSVPTPVEGNGSAVGSGRIGEPSLTALYSTAAEDIENRISRIRGLIEEIERVV